MYQGYVDDPRSTDHAWIETIAVHFHCNEELGRMLPLASGDDAAQVMWLDVNPDNPTYAALYASHRQYVDMAASRLAGEGVKSSLPLRP
mmetsp:Transcript_69234/g.137294  ORF Transcript_69234/g.137294 Transcript_69234/m.137294 type:complete len:89 (-) Transcript_69234:234-500(-)